MNALLGKHKLIEIADVIRGVSFGNAEGQDRYVDDHYPVLRAGNIQGCLVLESDLVWVPKSRISQNQFIKKDDIIMCTSSGSATVVGKCARAESDWQGSFGAFCAGIRPNNSKCNPSYLLHYLRSPAFTNWSSLSSGANIKNIRKSELEDFEIPLPPLTEQRRIAAILDKADAIRRKRQESIRLTEEFLRSTFLDMFGDSVTNPKGWKVSNLGKCCGFVAGNSLPEGEPFKGQENGILLLKVSDMNQVGNETFLSQGKEWFPLNRYNNIAPINSIILPKRGGAISTNKKRILTRPALLDPNLMGVYPQSERITSRYLFQWFQSFDLTSISSGSAVPQLNKQDLIPLEILIPPISEQAKFESIFNKVFEVKNKFFRQGHDELFSSLTHRAFRGEL